MKSVRAALLVTLGLASAGCGLPNTTDIDPMEHQPKFKPYRTSSFFDDKRTMRAPPKDTVAQEHDFGNPMGDMPDGGVPKVPEGNPVPLTSALLDLGQAKYNQVCYVCHGYVANGVSVVARKMSIRPPPSLITEEYRNKSDAFFFNAITNGYGYMNPYRDMLSSQERWAVVAYLRALQVSQNTVAATLSPQEMSMVKAPPKKAEGEEGHGEEGGSHE